MKKIFFYLLVTPSLVFAGQLSLTLENDFPFHDDSDYSHGTRVEYIMDSNWRYGLQQQMYTPYDLKNEDQVEGRHPYVGYLVGFVGYRHIKDLWPHISTHDDIELQLGVLGPSSHAEETQKFMHKILDCRYPAGWDHQLHDEAVLQLSYWKNFDFLLFGRDRGWGGHLETEVGGLLGTLQMAPGANMNFKFGYGFEPNETYTEIRVRSRQKPNISVYFLGGIGGYWWIRNELLDGNADYVGNTDTLTVEKEPLTGCFRTGIGLRYKKLETKLLVLRCTREFKTQETTPNYVSFSVGWDF